MKNFILEIFKLYLEGIKMLVPLIVGFFPFLATIMTIKYYEKKDENEKKENKKEREKKILLERLLSISENLRNRNEFYMGVINEIVYYVDEKNIISRLENGNFDFNIESNKNMKINKEIYEIIRRKYSSEYFPDAQLWLDIFIFFEDLFQTYHLYIRESQIILNLLQINYKNALEITYYSLLMEENRRNQIYTNLMNAIKEKVKGIIERDKKWYLFVKKGLKLFEKYRKYGIIRRW